ncbi:MAG TPA: hypothetical protein VNJ54_14925 [Plantibacter sp.]|uniref:hypothetical protein n=1 Tax=unclassified Plantibacter TaxID=2624265 RepID=UPI002C772389|nr:hypothetical protein [Plantibacter sp.]
MHGVAGIEDPTSLLDRSERCDAREEPGAGVEAGCRRCIRIAEHPGEHLVGDRGARARRSTPHLDHLGPLRERTARRRCRVGPPLRRLQFGLRTVPPCEHTAPADLLAANVVIGLRLDCGIDVKGSDGSPHVAEHGEGPRLLQCGRDRRDEGVCTGCEQLSVAWEPGDVRDVGGGEQHLGRRLSSRVREDVLIRGVGPVPPDDEALVRRQPGTTLQIGDEETLHAVVRAQPPGVAPVGQRRPGVELVRHHPVQ